jgi:hypothetical protein
MATSTCQPVVFFERRAKAIVRERINVMIVTASHGMVVNQRIHDCFFCRFHHAGKKWVHQMIGNCLDIMRDLIWIRGIRIPS